MSLLDEPGLPPLALRARLRYDLVSRVVGDLRPRSALEIGCGQGAVGARLARAMEYVGVEPDETSYAVARDRIEPVGGNVVLGTDADLPPGTTYDLVCAFEVLEHIRHDQAALEAWVARLSPGGHLVLSVPADQERFGPMDERAGHFRRYDEASLSEVARAAGLVDMRVHRYGWPLSYALEGVRNQLDKRRRDAASGHEPEELSAASGRTFQPTRPLTGRAFELAALPFCYLQRVRPQAGTGLVLVAAKA